MGSANSDFLTIGRFAEHAELSISMLRHYDRLGLLRPAATNPETGYRLYDPRQVADAWLIRLMRDLDLPLSEIEAVLEMHSVPAQVEVLARHRARLREQLRRTQAVLDRLERAIDEQGLMPYEVDRAELESCWVVSCRAFASHDRLDATIIALVGELEQLVDRLGLRCADRELVLYHNGITRAAGHDLEVCLPLAGREGGAAAGAWELPGGLAATVLHRGPWDGIRSAYVALFDWIVAHDYEFAGPIREQYVVDERDGAGPERYLTRLTVPIART